MRPGKVILLSAVTVVGVTWVAGKVSALGRVWPIKG